MPFLQQPDSLATAYESIVLDNDNDNHYDVAESIEPDTSVVSAMIMDTRQTTSEEEEDTSSSSGGSSHGSEHCQIENGLEKTVIRQMSSQSASAIQQRNAILYNNGLEQAAVEAEQGHKILISSSSTIKVQGDTTVVEAEESGDCSEPVKPPRLKKLARLQKQELSRTRSDEDMLQQQQRSGRLEISAPVLLATTLNPNDAEGHKSLQQQQQQRTFVMRKSASVSNSLADQHSLSATSTTSVFKDLSKRFSASSLFSSLTSSSSIRDSPSNSSLQVNPLNRSSFYVAEAIYEAEAAAGKLSPLSDHIYEEIPERNQSSLSSVSSSESEDPQLQQQGQRPLPPIPEENRKRRNRSIFEGASKYEILHYLRDAKDRIGHGDYEIGSAAHDNPEQQAKHCSSSASSVIGDDDANLVGLIRRNHTHRVSAISTASESSNCSSVDSVGSSEGGAVLLRGPTDRLLGMGTDIERTDSGVGSEASVEEAVEGKRRSSKDQARVSYVQKMLNTEAEAGNTTLPVAAVISPGRCVDCDQWLENKT
jgi:hypothetical protein